MKDSLSKQRVDRILELVDGGRLHHTSFLNLRLNLYFITENCTRSIKALTSLEETKSPLACVIYNMMEDVKQYLLAGLTVHKYLSQDGSLFYARVTSGQSGT